MRSAGLEPHLLKYARDAVAHGGGRRKRKVDNAEGHIEPFRCLGGDHLTHARYLERGLFYSFCDDVERCALALLQRVVHDAGA